MIKISKTVLLICIIVTGLFLPLCGIVLLNSINPMQLAFITSFTVENQSGQDIWVTPIGTVGMEGRKKQLPIYITAFPAFPAVKTGRFHLKNGQTRKFRYDGDDINFSEIVVESKIGQFYQLVVNLKTTENQYHAPKSRYYVIPVLETLPPIQSNVLEATVKSNTRWRPFLLIVVSIVLPVMFWRMVVHCRKEKSNSPKICGETE